jgi:hypothetical protein
MHQNSFGAPFPTLYDLILFGVPRIPPCSAAAVIPFFSIRQAGLLVVENSPVLLPLSFSIPSDNQFYIEYYIE